MKPQTIKIDTTKVIKLVKEKAKEISPALELRVNSVPTFNKASEFMKVIREAKTLLKEKKKSILDPLKEAKEQIELLFEPAEINILNIEIHLKNQIGLYNTHLIEEQTAKAKQAEKDIKAGKDVDKIAENLDKIENKINSIPTMHVWKIEIIDFKKVPDEFKMLNDSKAKLAAKTGIKVEGLKFTQEEVIVNRFQ